MKREVIAQSLAISEDGVELSFMVVPDDVRSGGMVVSSRSVAIAFTSPAGLGEAAVDLRTAVDALASLFLEKLEELAPYEAPKSEALGYSSPAPDDEGDEDDLGMGDGR